ncbi:MAG: DUF349 domain-containing protein [Cyclobacteriaceae bacterium]
MKNTTVPFGYEKAGRLYLNSWADHPEKEIGEVRDGDIEKSVAFFVERFEDLNSKIEEVAKKIDETENKGSFLMKLLHLKDQLPLHDGLGDYLVLQEKIERYESLVRDIIKKNRERNSEIKKALIEEAKEAVEVINWKEGTEKVNDLKSRWIKTGNAEEDKNEQLEADFWKLVKGFFDRKKNFYEDKQKLIDHRRRQYEELVSEAEATKELHGRKKIEKIRELREKWKNTGGVPNDVFKPLVEAFNNNLKPQQSHSFIDYSEVIASLEAVKKGDAPFNKKELDLLKKNVFRDKARNPDKGRVLELIQLLIERDFVNSLANKRFPNFPQLDHEKKKSIRSGIVRDLLLRDKDELKLFEENSGNFNSSDGSMSKMIDGRLKSQKRKIEIKTQLLDWIERNEF